MKDTELKQYIIDGGEEGADRLTILANATWNFSENFLRLAGLTSGMSVIDLGCGNGAITNRIASAFGPSTRIIGLDANETVLKFARQDALIQNLNVIYEPCNLEGSLPQGEFDFVYVRFMLSHLQDPQKLLLKIKPLLKPEGIVAIEDVDFNGHFSYPNSKAFDQYVDAYRRIGEMKGVDPMIGPRLPGLLRSAGFQDVQMSVTAPVYESGPGKLMAFLTLKSIKKSVLEAGLMTEESIENLIEDLELFTKSPESIMSLPRFFQVFAKNY